MYFIFGWVVYLYSKNINAMTLQDRLNDIAIDPTLTDISEANLVELLREQNTSVFSAFKSVTKRTDLNKYDAYFIEVEGKKKKNPNAVLNPYLESGIVNYAEKFRIVTGFDYKNAIKERMKKAGIMEEFESGQSWHTALSNSLSVHKEKPNDFYFKYQYTETSNTLLEHYHQNDPIGYAMFERFLQDREDYSNQKKQGLDKTLNVQVISIKNLLTISIDHQRYRVIH
jgi:hypothetical protein